MIQRSVRNPPSAGYARPQKPGFYVWQDRHLTFPPSMVRAGKRSAHPWRWLCTFCDPPVAGYRCRAGAWRSIIETAMPRHFFVRAQHHDWVARNRRPAKSTTDDNA